MDFLNVYLPITGIEINLLVLVAIGFCVGTLGGFFGVGAAWIVTPALNIFGFTMPFAVGTNLAAIFGKSLITTRSYSKLGNIDWRMAMYSIVGSIVGIEAGKRLVLQLEVAGTVGPVVRWAYMVFLFGLGSFMLFDYYTTVKGKNEREDDRSPATTEATEPSPSVAAMLRRIRIPPMISLPTSGIERISFWVVFLLFLFTGFLSGFMGIGGGFILLPALIYLLGCATTVAVGTSLLGVCFITGYGCFSYSLSGHTEPLAAIVILIGAAIGGQVGFVATRFVRGYGIRLLFAIMIVLAGCSVACKQIQGFWHAEVFGTLAFYVLMLSAGGVSAWIVVNSWIGSHKQKKQMTATGQGRNA